MHSDRIQVLDHGYVQFIEAWGHGLAGITDYECGIIEAARQSTQGSFRGWEDQPCQCCNGSIDSGGTDPSGEPITVTCPDCDGKGYLPGDQRLLKFLFTNKPPHATPFEFSGIVIEVQAPIFVYREWHRHRTQSYNEMSARYAPLPDLNYIPTVERLLLNQGTKNKQAGTIKGARELTAEDAEFYRKQLTAAYVEDQKLYDWALSIGVPKEVARVHLPVGRYSRMRASANLRNWLAFMTLRADPAAQWEIRQFAQVVGTILDSLFPRTYTLWQEQIGVK